MTGHPVDRGRLPTATAAAAATAAATVIVLGNFLAEGLDFADGLFGNSVHGKAFSEEGLGIYWERRHQLAVLVIWNSLLMKQTYCTLRANSLLTRLIRHNSFSI